MDAVIIGMGRMGMKHAETLTAAGHHIMATANSDAEAMRALNVCRADIAIIASPDHCHAAQVSMALFQGMHVFCEKPLVVPGNNLAELEDMISAADRKVMVHFPLRYLEELRKAKMTLHELGQIYAFSGGYQWGRLKNLKNGWRGKNPHYSIVMGGLIHTIDIMQWLMGEEFAVSSAVGGNVVYEEFDGPLYVRSLLSMDGAIGTAFADFSYDGGHQHFLQFLGTEHNHSLEIRGEAPKEPALQDFLGCIMHDRDTGIRGMISAHRVALEIDRMARAA